MKGNRGSRRCEVCGGPFNNIREIKCKKCGSLTGKKLKPLFAEGEDYLDSMSRVIEDEM